MSGSETTVCVTFGARSLSAVLALRQPLGGLGLGWFCWPFRTHCFSGSSKISAVSTKVLWGTDLYRLKNHEKLLSCYDSYDAAHMSLMNLKVKHWFWGTPLTEECLFWKPGFRLPGIFFKNDAWDSHAAARWYYDFYHLEDRGAKSSKFLSILMLRLLSRKRL